MKHLSAIFLFIFAILQASATAGAGEPDFEKAVRAFYANAFSVENTRMDVQVPSGFETGQSAFIEFTNKGNGVLHVKNLSLRVFDINPDGIYYDGGTLHVVFLKDVEGQECVAVSGTVILGEDDKVADKQSLLLVYRFDKRHSKFERIVAVIPFAEEKYLLEKM